MNLLTRTLFNLFIQTQKTPNPNFLKFLPVSKVVMGDKQSIDIRSLQDASRISPLARKMFRIKGVNQVFYGKNYISIAKQQAYNWTELKPQIFGLIQEHYESDEPLIVDKSAIDDQGINENDSQTVKMIKQILASRVRPFVQDDGGDVKFVQFNDQTGVLKLKMLGSCSGCPSSSATLRNGILKAMAYYVGQVKNVVSVDQQENNDKTKEQGKKHDHEHHDKKSSQKQQHKH